MNTEEAIQKAADAVTTEDVAILADDALLNVSRAVAGHIKGAKVIEPFVAGLTRHVYKNELRFAEVETLKAFIQRVLAVVDCTATPPDDFEGEDKKAYRNRYDYVLRVTVAKVADNIGLEIPVSVPEFDPAAIVDRLFKKWAGKGQIDKLANTLAKKAGFIITKAPIAPTDAEKAKTDKASAKKAILETRAMLAAQKAA